MRSRLLHRGREGSGYERTLSPHVVPANAGTHNHRRAWLRRQLPQRLKRDHAVWVPAFAGTTGWSGRKGDVMDAISLHVVPANAGTHNHRRLWLREVSASVPKERSRGMGPGVRRDDEDGILTSC